MAGEVKPKELAELLDVAERPRTEWWSLRAALTRYAQPQPQRASDLIELVRRIEAALKANAATIESSGAALWSAVEDESTSTDDALVGALRALRRIDVVP